MLRIEDEIENNTAMIKTVDYLESQIRKLNKDDGGTADQFAEATKKAIAELTAILKKGKVMR